MQLRPPRASGGPGEILGNKEIRPLRAKRKENILDHAIKIGLKCISKHSLQLKC